MFLLAIILAQKSYKYLFLHSYRTQNFEVKEFWTTTVDQQFRICMQLLTCNQIIFPPNQIQISRIDPHFLQWKFLSFPLFCCRFCSYCSSAPPISRSTILFRTVGCSGRLKTRKSCSADKRIFSKTCCSLIHLTQYLVKVIFLSTDTGTP